MVAAIDMTGRTFGRLTVQREAARIGNQRAFVARCECGSEITVRGCDLRSGNTRSCGCLAAEVHAVANVRRARHGESDKTTEYAIWHGIVQRCSPGHANSKRYYERGVRMCGRWRESFEAFRDDMGRRPSREHTIDRRDTTAHYSCGKCDECRERGWPANCRWATWKVQQRNKQNNRRITFRGETLTLSEWAERLGITHTALSDRLKKWSIEQALTTPRRAW